MKKFEFSKFAMVAAILMWIAGGIFGAVIVERSPEQLTPYLAYIASPVGVAYGFYYWKAKAENVIKAAKDIEKDSKNNKISMETKQQLIAGLANTIKNIETEDYPNGSQ